MANYNLYISGQCNGYQVDIFRKDWGGEAVNPQYLGVDGLVLNFFDGEFTKTISKTTLDITFHDDDLRAVYRDFFTADATKFKVVVSDGSNTIWQGYITPDSFSYSSGVPVTVTARDNVGYLEEVDFDLFGAFTINEVLTKAQELISWDAPAWTSVGEYTAENGTISHFDSVINCDAFEGTWFEMLEAILKGYQLRFIGNNNWQIIEVTHLQQLATQEHYIHEGSSEWTVVPSWRTYTTTFDFGVKESIYTYVQSESNYNGVATTEMIPVSFDNPSIKAPIDFYTNTAFFNYPTLNNYMYEDNGGDYHTDILLSARQDGYIADLRFPLPVTEDYGLGFAIKLNIGNFYLSRDGHTGAKLTPYHNRIKLPGSSFSTGVGYYLKCNFALGYVNSNTGRYLYLSDKGWDYEPYIISFDLSMVDDTYNEETQQYVFNNDFEEKTINVPSLPNVEGDLVLRIFKPDGISPDLHTGVVPMDSLLNDKDPAPVAWIIRDVQIEPKLINDNTSIELTGQINPNGNIKEDLELQYSETPKGVGGQSVLAHGLFKDNESIGNWQRSDTVGGVINLSENISRAYAHMYNSFTRGDEFFGGEVLAATLVEFSPSNIVVNGRLFSPTEYQWILSSDKSTITAQEVTPYAKSAAVWEQGVVDAGAKTAVKTSETSVLAWGDKALESKRVQQLPDYIAEQNGYLLIDQGGDSAAKILMSEIRPKELYDAFEFIYENGILVRIRAKGDFTADGYVAAGSASMGSGGGGGGLDINAMWQELRTTTYDPIKIVDLIHLPTIPTNKISGIPAWALEATKPSYTADDVGALAAGATAVAAAKLATARTLWGQSFDGSGNVSGDIRNLDNIYGSSQLYLHAPDVIAMVSSIDTNSGVAFISSEECFRPIRSSASVATLGKSSTRWGGVYSVDANVSNKTTTKVLQLSSTAGEAHLAFGRGSYNYITAPFGGSFAFVSNGKVLAGSSIDIHITDVGMGVKKINPTQALDVNGSILASGNIAASGYVAAGGASMASDRNLKDNIKPLGSALEYILGTNYVEHTWKRDGSKDVGIIAQDQEGREFNFLVKKNLGNFAYSFDYTKHSVLIGKSVQELHARIVELEKKIAHYGSWNRHS